MKTSEIREMSLEEMRRQEATLKETYFNLRFQHETGQLENSSMLEFGKQPCFESRHPPQIISNSCAAARDGSDFEANISCIWNPKHQGCFAAGKIARRQPHVSQQK